MGARTLTYYDILRVERDARPERLRRAYRKLAQQYHPDKTPGDELAGRRMAQLNEAYAVLSHPQHRARYDEHIDAIRSSRRLARERLVAALEDMGPAWPWVLLFATIALAAAAVSVSMWPSLFAARWH